MRLNVRVEGLDRVKAAFVQSERQARFAMSVALNKTAGIAQEKVQAEMRNVFDRPTPWALKSLRVSRATKTNLSAEMAYKDKGLYGSSRTMIEPHVTGASGRHHKAMEVRLHRAGYLPAGWWVVPGQAAKLDAFGNMSQGQISQLLNVLGTYTESGYNVANARTRDRLARGNARKGIYGFVYWVNPVGAGQRRGLQPGVYQRVSTGFGTSLKPVLIFVRKVAYRKRLDFYGIVDRTVQREFAGQFDAAFAEAMRTALLRQQGSLL